MKFYRYFPISITSQLVDILRTHERGAHTHANKRTETDRHTNMHTSIYQTIQLSLSIYHFIEQTFRSSVMNMDIRLFAYSLAHTDSLARSPSLSVCFS